MIGNTISHYRIVSQLGVGGMGIVYEALDPRLGRPVALKFVPEELAHDAHSLERLRMEARTASGLNHPNICTIYDVGEHEGRPFIVMELLKGQTLRERIALRPLKMHEVVDIGIQIADALDCAHARQVIHRDIKPANLFMVERGQVKILDFGLAKLLSRELGTQMTMAPTVDQTAAGVALGTVAYMSPEQVQGETLDGRTDLFSLGVVLYECVTGHQPFKGKTSAMVFASILTQAPTAPITLNPEVPARLQDVINNCLEKDRDLRCQEAGSLRAELKRVKRDLESGGARVAVSGSVALPGSGAASTVSVSTRSVSQPSPSEVPAPQSAAGAAPRSRAAWVAGGAAGVAVAAALAVVLSRSRETPGIVSAPVPATAPTASTGAALSPTPSSADARFDAAVVEANRMLATGDLDAATRAVNAARAVDPGSPAVADLSSRLMDMFRAQAAAERRTPPEPTRPALAPATRAQTARLPAGADAAPAARPSQSSPAPAPTAPSAPEVRGTLAQASPAAGLAPVPAPPARSPEPPPATAPSSAASVAPALDPRPSIAAPAIAASAEDDDAAIRRVVAAYARAIETKDVALFRSVKPNLTGDEQRRIEDGFRAVASQRVALTIDAIERRGQDAVVRLRRHDTIQAGGRQQTADSQQTMTLTRASAGWVIREIGR